MLFLSEDEETIIRYNKISKKVAKTCGFKLDSQPVKLTCQDQNTLNLC